MQKKQSPGHQTIVLKARMDFADTMESQQMLKMCTNNIVYNCSIQSVFCTFIHSSFSEILSWLCSTALDATCTIFSHYVTSILGPFKKIVGSRLVPHRWRYISSIGLLIHYRVIVLQWSSSWDKYAKVDLGVLDSYQILHDKGYIGQVCIFSLPRLG